MKLYVYDHCPFCVRPRIMAGLKGINIEIIYLLNDDVQTPTGMTGKKMLPILVTDSGEVISESLDIVDYIDNFSGTPLLSKPENIAIIKWTDDISSTVYQLSVPRWAYSPFEEFSTAQARQYFIDKKEAHFGRFSQLVNDTDNLLAHVNSALLELALLIDKNRGETKSDIILFPILRSLSIVQGIKWPESVNQWRLNFAHKSKVELHDNMAS